MKEKKLSPEGIIKAQRVKTFIEHLTFSKGTWAGKPFVLLPWQEKLIEDLFGNIKEDGMRQYRTCYLEIGKKNGKTELGAALALYMLCADGEKSPEVFGAACDKEQAGLIYNAAAIMVQNSPVLSKSLKVLDSRKRIINHKNNGFYQVLSSETRTKHGISPSAIFVDELHAMPDAVLYEILVSGTDYARKQQLVFVTTTAGIYKKTSIWWKIRTQAQQVDAGIIEDPRFLPVLYIADPEKDDPEDEEVWKNSNPSIGHIFTIDKIREDFLEAKNNPVDFQNFKRYRLCLPIRQLHKWMNMDKWDACSGEVASLVGRKCYGGLDLSLKLDMTAFVMVFAPAEGNDTYDILCKFYCPEEGILLRSQRDRVNYDIWQRQGFLTATPGETVDYTYIERDILEAVKKYEIIQIGFDPWKATSTYNRIMAELNPINNEQGFQMVEVRQGAKSMHEPAQDLLVNIMKGKVRHGGNPILRWNMDNMVMKPDSNENLTPDKSKAVERIDGGVSLIMAWGRMLFGKEIKSCYEDRGIIVL